MTEALVERSLTSYLPPHVLRRLTSPAPAPAPHAERFQAAVLLADIRGFTRMTELMASRGPDGVEMFTDAMNRYFGAMIDCVAEHGGEVVSFAGDALLAVWPGERRDGRPPPWTPPRAARSCSPPATPPSPPASTPACACASRSPPARSRASRSAARAARSTAP